MPTGGAGAGGGWDAWVLTAGVSRAVGPSRRSAACYLATAADLRRAALRVKADVIAARRRDQPSDTTGRGTPRVRQPRHETRAHALQISGEQASRSATWSRCGRCRRVRADRTTAVILAACRAASHVSATERRQVSRPSAARVQLAGRPARFGARHRRHDGPVLTCPGTLVDRICAGPARASSPRSAVAFAPLTSTGNRLNPVAHPVAHSVAVHVW